MPLYKTIYNYEKLFWAIVSLGALLRGPKNGNFEVVGIKPATFTKSLLCMPVLHISFSAFIRRDIAVWAIEIQGPCSGAPTMTTLR